MSNQVYLNSTTKYSFPSTLGIYQLSANHVIHNPNTVVGPYTVIKACDGLTIDEFGIFDVVTPGVYSFSGSVEALSVSVNPQIFKLEWARHFDGFSDTINQITRATGDNTQIGSPFTGYSLDLTIGLNAGESVWLEVGFNDTVNVIAGGVNRYSYVIAQRIL